MGGRYFEAHGAAAPSKACLCVLFHIDYITFLKSTPQLYDSQPTNQDGPGFWASRSPSAQ